MAKIDQASAQDSSSHESATWKTPFLKTPPFPETSAYHSLQVLARRLPDLTSAKILTSERLKKYQASCGGFTLMYGFQQINDEIINELKLLASERKVIEQMQAMQEGRVVNWIEGYPSERRTALHTAMRGTSSSSSSQEAASAIRLAETEIQKLESVMSDIEKDGRFDTMLFIGIGGSELGPHAIAEALAPYWKKDRKVFYAANVDPDELSHAFEKILPEKTIVVIVSKSGTTLETATNEARVRDFYEKKGLSFKDHSIAVTCPSTPMDNPQNYRACLHLFDFVGGRYSSTSMVGGVLIAFLAGINVFKQFLEGARQVDEKALSPDLSENVPLLMALLGIWNRNFLQYPTTAIIPYATGLHRFPAHLQQCDMESNGKSFLRTGRWASFATGPVVWGEPGTNAQHSFFQLIHQGSDIIPVEFIGFRKSQRGHDFAFRGTSSHYKLLANMFAQALALAQGRKSNENPNASFSGNRPSSILIADQLTPQRVGALLALYENKIAFQGFIWGVNSFDQEGVQLGKILADRFLNHLKQDDQRGKDELSDVEMMLVNMIAK